jgi:hypothetical protein
MDKKIIGSLLNSIEYYDVWDLDRFIKELNDEQALYCIIEAVKVAHQKSIYTMEETELISKAIRVLTTPPNNNDQEEPKSEN